MPDVPDVKLSFNIRFVMLSSLFNKLVGFECRNERGAECGAISGATFTRLYYIKVRSVVNRFTAPCR